MSEDEGAYIHRIAYEEIRKYSDQMREAASKVTNPLTEWGLLVLGALMFLFLALEVIFGVVSISDAKFFAILAVGVTLVLAGQCINILSDRSKRWYYKADLDHRISYLKYALEDEKLDIAKREQRDKLANPKNDFERGGIEP